MRRRLACEISKALSTALPQAYFIVVCVKTNATRHENLPIANRSSILVLCPPLLNVKAKA